MPETSQFQNENIRLASWANKVEQQINAIYDKANGNTPKPIKKSLFSISHYREQLVKELNEPLVSEAIIDETLLALRARAEELRLKIRGLNVDETGVIEASQDLCRTILEETQKIETSSFTPTKANEAERLTGAIEVLKRQITALQNENNKIRQQIRSTQQSATETEVSIKSLDDRIVEALRVSQSKADDIFDEIQEKRKEIFELVDLVSGESIAGSFAKSALQEMKMADSMRNGSVLLMLCIAILVGLSLYETGQPHFSWETALFRLIFSLALSVPAAYLARESSKHRDQQYTYQSNSLDLQAITPYIASLPLDEQHSLKLEIAKRIFGSRGTAKSSLDSYPVNINEVLMALLAKINPSKQKED